MTLSTNISTDIWLIQSQHICLLHLSHFFYINSAIINWARICKVNMVCSSACSIEYELLKGINKYACFSFGLTSRSRPCRRETFAWRPGMGLKLSSTRISVPVPCTGKAKILPPNTFVVVVSPLKALRSDQLESCQRLKFKALKMELELFNNDGKLKKLVVWVKGFTLACATSIAWWLCH